MAIQELASGLQQQIDVEEEKETILNQNMILIDQLFAQRPTLSAQFRMPPQGSTISFNQTNYLQLVIANQVYQIPLVNISVS